MDMTDFPKYVARKNGEHYPLSPPALRFKPLNTGKFRSPWGRVSNDFHAKMHTQHCYLLVASKARAHTHTCIYVWWKLLWASELPKHSKIQQPFVVSFADWVEEDPFYRSKIVEIKNTIGAFLFWYETKPDPLLLPKEPLKMTSKVNDQKCSCLVAYHELALLIKAKPQDNLEVVWPVLDKLLMNQPNSNDFRAQSRLKPFKNYP